MATSKIDSLVKYIQMYANICKYICIGKYGSLQYT